MKRYLVSELITDSVSTSGWQAVRRRRSTCLLARDLCDQDLIDNSKVETFTRVFTNHKQGFPFTMPAIVLFSTKDGMC